MDITGRRYGKLVALRPTGEKYQGASLWLCACDCGKLVTVSIGNLNSGQRKSCGCGRVKDITGQRFGKLTAVRWVRKRGRTNIWLCSCACGKQKEFPLDRLTGGRVKDCGCGARAVIPFDQQLDALAWAANNAGETYGRFVSHLSSDEKQAVFDQYAAFLREPRRIRSAV